MNAAFFKVDEKTFRKWCWIFVDIISELQIVSAFLTFTCMFSFSNYVSGALVK